MVNTIMPIGSGAAAFNNVVQATSGMNNSNLDFNTILGTLATRSPDISSLLGTESQDNTSSIFGSNNSLLSGLSGTGSNIGAGSLEHAMTMQALMPVWVGKTVEAKDPKTGEAITGKVDSVDFENGVVILSVGDSKVPTSSVTKVS